MITTMLAFYLGVIVGGLGGFLFIGLLLLIKERRREAEEMPGYLGSTHNGAESMQMESDFEDTEVILPAVPPERSANVIFLDSLRH